MGMKKYILISLLTSALLVSSTGCSFGSDKQAFGSGDSDKNFEYDDDARDDDDRYEDHEEDEKSRAEIRDDAESDEPAATEPPVTEAPETEPPATEPDNSAWRTEYKNILASFDYPDMAFDLVFIDDDNIPELVVSEGLAHVAGCNIYTMYNGSCVELGNYGVYGEIGYVKYDGDIMVADVNQGYSTYFVAEIKDGAIQTVMTAFDNTGAVMSEAEYEFKVNDNIVTQNDFQSKVSPYFGDPELRWAGRRYSMNPDVINAALNAEPPASYVEPEAEAPTQAPAAYPVTGRVITQDDDLNVRSGPSVDFEKIGTVAKGSTVVILGEQNGWYIIEFPGGTGYVSAEYISVQSTAHVS